MSEQMKKEDNKLRRDIRVKHISDKTEMLSRIVEGGPTPQELDRRIRFELTKLTTEYQKILDEIAQQN